MEVILLVLFAIIVIPIIVVARENSRNKEVWRTQTNDVNLFVQELEKSGFTVNRNLTFGHNSLFVDNKHKKWAVMASGYPKARIFDFTDLINFEICQDAGSSVISGNTGKALLGGALLGGIGAVAGSAGSREIKNTTQTLQLRIRIRDLNTPELLLYFIANGKATLPVTNETAIHACRTIASALVYIMDDNETQNANRLNVAPASIEDIIRQLAKLKEDGLITDLEYDEKRKELLSKL